MEFPEDVKYHSEHMWVRDDDGDAQVGISDFAQDQLGTVLYVDLPEEGQELVAGDELGAVESAKSVSDLISPVSGTVISVNEDLSDTPSLINEDPYGAGWIVVIELDGDEDLAELMDAKAYQDSIS